MANKVTATEALIALNNQAHNAYLNNIQQTINLMYHNISKQLALDLYGFNPITIRKWYGSKKRSIVKYNNKTLIYFKV